MNITMANAIHKAIFGVSEYEETFEACDLCYNLTCKSSLRRIYDKQENCYKLCNDCFDVEPKKYVKFGEHSGVEYGSLYFKD